MNKKLISVASMLMAVLFIAVMGIITITINNTGKEKADTMKLPSIGIELKVGEEYTGGFIKDLSYQKRVYLDGVNVNEKNFDYDNKYTCTSLDDKSAYFKS